MRRRPPEVKRLILLAEDDELPMEYYIRALERRGFTVKQCFNPDEAIESAKAHGADAAAIILDIMMPHGERYGCEETHEGLRTGVLLYADLRKLLPSIPVMVLTNVKNQETFAEFPQEPLLEVVQKMDYPPAAFAALLCEVISRAGNGASVPGKEPNPDAWSAPSGASSN